MLCLNLIDNIAALFRRLFYTMKSMHMVMYTRVMCMYIELYALDNLLMDILVLRMAAALVGICLVMSWFIAPETKGKSLAETSALEGIDSVYKAR